MKDSVAYRKGIRLIFLNQDVDAIKLFLIGNLYFKSGNASKTRDISESSRQSFLFCLTTINFIKNK